MVECLYDFFGFKNLDILLVWYFLCFYIIFHPKIIRYLFFLKFFIFSLLKIY